MGIGGALAGALSANGASSQSWHISDLQIYDEPKELSAFGISRPPQSWMYVHKPKGGQVS